MKKYLTYKVEDYRETAEYAMDFSQIKEIKIDYKPNYDKENDKTTLTYKLHFYCIDIYDDIKCITFDLDKKANLNEIIYILENYPGSIISQEVLNACLDSSDILDFKENSQ